VTDKAHFTNAQSVEKMSDVFDSRNRVITTNRLIRLADASTSQTNSVESVDKPRCEIVIDMRSVIKASEEQNRVAAATPIEVMQLDAVRSDKAAFRAKNVRGIGRRC